MVRRTSEPEFIRVRGAREHNLKVDDLSIPKRKLVVLTGVSGSGKSSLAFDTLYAEGQRRYVESLSAYARQFLGQMDKPRYESIRGLSPTIAIEQKSASSNPRSTVGTITEIYDYLRVLFARVGEQRCHLCGGPVQPQSAAEIVEQVLALPEGTRLMVLAPTVVGRKGEHREILGEAQKKGYSRARIDGKIVKIQEAPALDKKKKHSLEIVVDRLTARAEDRPRITDAVEGALKLGEGTLILAIDGGEERALSEARACPTCGIGFPELAPSAFSFNSPLGMCPDCTGLGSSMEMDAALVVPDPSLSIRAGAIEPWATAVTRGEGWVWNIIRALTEEFGIDLDVPWQKLPAAKRDLILQGSGEQRVQVKWEGRHGGGSWAMRFEGILHSLMRRYKQTSSEPMRQHYEKYLREAKCRACLGERLRPESRAVRIGAPPNDRSIVGVTSLTVGGAKAWFEAIGLAGSRAVIAKEILKEIDNRLSFLLNVGLDYLSLDRAAATLSGGEAQRIRLASQLGAELSGVMYILDEPSIGLHQRDNRRLIETLQSLRDLGNTVLVVEHDEETIESADWVVDFGPGAGELGGAVVFSGTPAALRKDRKSLTGAYLAGRERIEQPSHRRAPKGTLRVRGAREHNLKDIDAAFPLGVLTAITGVSGAGKSSLINAILYPALRRHLHASLDPIGAHDAIEGIEQIDKVVAIDQQPIGRTPRSNSATYTKAFDHIRDLYANLPESRAYGFAAGRFSFNVKGGRCEACEGDGVKRVEMHFLADVFVPCEVCRGRRYNDATLRVKYKGLSIADLLETSIARALDLFQHHPSLKQILGTLVDVGLGYVALGQPAPTLSGGEAQRVKLARELCRRDTGRTLYLLDEPTTGLHFDDVKKLLAVLGRLVDAGNTVIVIEHNLDVVKTADWVIDLGPEGGAAGGEIVAAGPPEAIALAAASHTGRYLRPLLRVARRA
ncbi:MAG: excinuclease ABC subunit UvrA [Myxococcales bacterium]|nr:excinuclease ABC subunit UvrA [Myxococcales bacterium]